MSDGLYVTGTEPATGKSAVALGMHELLARRVGRLGVFRPVVGALDAPDPVVDLLRPRAADPAPYEASLGVSHAALRADEDAGLAEIVARYRMLAARCERVLVVGSDFTEAGASGELALNARIAVNLGIPVLCVASGRDRRGPQVEEAVDVGIAALQAAGCEVLAAVVNRVAEQELAGVQARLAGREAVPVYALPDVGLLTAPTLGDVAAACDGEVIAGDGELVGREALGVVVAAMTLPNLLDRLLDDIVVITPGDRADVLLGVLAAHASGALPAPAGIVLTGGLRPPATVLRLVESLPSIPPVVLTSHDTYETARRTGGLLGRITAGARRKVDTALALWEEHVPGEELLLRVAGARTRVVTPLMFEYELLDRARADRRHIVLPEGDDERVLQAADTLLRRGVVELTLLGDPGRMRAACSRMSLDLSDARFVDPCDEELRERLAAEYAARRAHKGVTLDQARDVVTDVSYMGTLMVALGMADGMVSGATHTTAQTIRPSLELVKTRPGVSLVSSVFFMCLSDRVLVYGDCAVNVHPSAEQLAEIAISSADTASRFGVEPRIAMLSYSTGTSGSGEEVDRVRAATELVRERAPALFVEGPIQYDAAVDAGVARTKLPDSQVAGRATVFVFPDLNTGNNTYKAVQRSAGAVAVGPVLQGLRRPVNDLSRGATVQDIVTTVAITAIQAQDGAAA
ncbi:MAG: BioD-like N-terminal domain / Phosphate acetyltransferase [uncultured Thermoleophilia bacterium]|uniref:Phosphate acetyltransferase n=1 Tax=uncultured Thermoleophilia bacterium TaxID=1497501 RepID=A0A6J4UD84_9ACTN|nr:MAG: BioD-like N-terminal domain / Phosphate acetyltransferase [uncultured Thermoleophilia bacterium]